MFPSLVSSSSLRVLLVAYFALNLDKIRSLFSFDIMANELIEVHLFLGLIVFVKICLKI